MTAAITMGSVLLALLSAWGLTFRHDARTGRRADPIGEVFEVWLEPPARPSEPTRRRPRRRLVVASPSGHVHPGDPH